MTILAPSQVLHLLKQLTYNNFHGDHRQQSLQIQGLSDNPIYLSWIALRSKNSHEVCEDVISFPLVNII